MTRDLKWGVPALEGAGKVLYVWLDAPIGYHFYYGVGGEERRRLERLVAEL